MLNNIDGFIPIYRAFVMPSSDAQLVLHPPIQIPTVEFSWIIIVKYLLFIFYGLGSLFGVLRSKNILQVGLSRKYFCMTFFLTGFIIPYFVHVPRFKSIPFPMITTSVTILFILSLAKSIRTKFIFSRLTFQAVSRDGEDEHTVLWLWTEALVTSLIVYLGSLVLHEKSSYPYLLMIPAFASGLADSAAEIVGTKWGKHPYQTKGFFWKKDFYRTLEGSLAFFGVCTVISLICYLTSGTILDDHTISALVILPFVLTLAEALSPHSWDNPFIFLTGYMTVWLLSTVL